MFSSRIYLLVKVLGFCTFAPFFLPKMLNWECKNWHLLPYGQNPVSWNWMHALVLKLGGTCFFFTSSWCPCANEHVLRNLQVPLISQFLHISVFSFAVYYLTNWSLSLSEANFFFGRLIVAVSSIHSSSVTVVAALELYLVNLAGAMLGCWFKFDPM